jgi:hypothetical protein
MEMTVDRASGRVTVNYTDDDGKEQTASQSMRWPPDLADGLVPMPLREAAAGTPKTFASTVVATPKPRLMKLSTAPQGEDSFSVATTGHKATQYDARIDIGGAAGVVAPAAGKQPPDLHVRIAQGEAPVFGNSEGPMFAGGPVWRIELARPMWPKGADQESNSGR